MNEVILRMPPPAGRTAPKVWQPWRSPEDAREESPGGDSGARIGNTSPPPTSTSTGSLRKWRKERRCVAGSAKAAAGVEARLPGSTAAAAAKLFLLVPLSVRGSASIPSSSIPASGVKEAVSTGPGTLLKLESREEKATDECSGKDGREKDLSGPLDMTQSREESTKCSNDSPPPQHQRPSVITCVTAAGRLPSFSSPSSPISPSSAIPEKSKSEDSDDETRKLGLRREINSDDSCDPVIDEHFRRSLGSDYAHLFSPKPSSSVGATPGNGDAGGNSVTITGMSVDDHFAKALGETWLKLQAAEMTKEERKSNSATDGDTKNSQRRGLVWCPPIEGDLSQILVRDRGVKNFVGNYSTENK